MTIWTCETHAAAEELCDFLNHSFNLGVYAEDIEVRLMPRASGHEYQEVLLNQVKNCISSVELTKTVVTRFHRECNRKSIRNKPA